jgi:hypothetical protein
VHRGCETRNRPSDTVAALVSAATLLVGRMVNHCDEGLLTTAAAMNLQSLAARLQWALWPAEQAATPAARREYCLVALSRSGLNFLENAKQPTGCEHLFVCDGGLKRRYVIGDSADQANHASTVCLVCLTLGRMQQHRDLEMASSR